MSFPEPIIIGPSTATAALIFLHGYEDEGDSYTNLANQFQTAGKLPHMKWVFPTAKINRDAMAHAWYTPHSLAARPPSRPELEESEDEDGMLDSVSYIESLIDRLVAEGIPPERIVLGGFSQGHVISLLTSLLSSKYSGKLAGVVALSGYLALGAQRIKTLRTQYGLSERLSDDDRKYVFLARGMRDLLIPKRYHRMGLDALEELGLDEKSITVKEYEGLGHSIAPVELREMCEWLENVVPPLDEAK